MVDLDEAREELEPDAEVAPPCNDLDANDVFEGEEACIVETVLFLACVAAADTGPFWLTARGRAATAAATALPCPSLPLIRFVLLSLSVAVVESGLGAAVPALALVPARRAAATSSALLATSLLRPFMLQCWRMDPSPFHTLACAVSKRALPFAGEVALLSVRGFDDGATVDVEEDEGITAADRPDAARRALSCSRTEDVADEGRGAVVVGAGAASAGVGAAVVVVADVAGHEKVNFGPALASEAGEGGGRGG